jgi:hypothetical protein
MSNWKTEVESICEKHNVTLPYRNVVGMLSKADITSVILDRDGLSYDFALPQGSVDYWMDTHSIDIRKDFVMAYPRGSVMGVIFPLTRDAFELLDAAIEKEEAETQ